MSDAPTPITLSDLLQLVRCPRCHGRLTGREGEPRLSCASCRVAYPIVDGIPVLLVDEAKAIEGKA